MAQTQGQRWDQELVSFAGYKCYQVLHKLMSLIQYHLHCQVAITDTVDQQFDWCTEIPAWVVTITKHLGKSL